MADIIDFLTGKHYRRDAESEASLADEGSAPVIMPDENERRHAEALLIAQADKENAKWAKKINARRFRVSLFRIGLLLLGVITGLLQWWWVCAAAFCIMLLAYKVAK